MLAVSCWSVWFCFSCVNFEIWIFHYCVQRAFQFFFRFCRHSSQSGDNPIRERYFFFWPLQLLRVFAVNTTLNHLFLYGTTPPSRRYQKRVLISSPSPRPIGVRKPWSFASRATVVIAHTRRRRARKPLRDPIMGPRRLGCRSRSRCILYCFTVRDRLSHCSDGGGGYRSKRPR